MDEKQPKLLGTCFLCGEVFQKTGMTNHLKACLRQHAESGETQLFTIRIDGKYQRGYWMYLEVPADMKLSALDRFIRDIWVECCGHLSEFTIHGTNYSSHAGKRGIAAKSMNVPLNRVVSPGTTFSYLYDFGTSTRVRLKILAQRQGQPLGENQICLLARNEPPPVTCECGSDPKYVCSVCGTCLCEECAEDHEHARTMLLPFVNSPRTGRCGYTGPHVDWHNFLPPSSPLTNS